MKVKVKTGTGPHVIIDSGVYIGEPLLEDMGDIPVDPPLPLLEQTQ
jgi:hypothetical protein